MLQSAGQLSGNLLKTATKWKRGRKNARSRQKQSKKLCKTLIKINVRKSVKREQIVIFLIPAERRGGRKSSTQSAEA